MISKILEKIGENLSKNKPINFEDPRTRLGCLDVYFSMFGLGIPPVKGGPPHAPGHHR